MIKALSVKILSLALLFSCTSSVFAQNEKAEADLREIMKKLDVVGLSVAVVKEGDIIYSNSFGLKNIETKAPLTDTDIFRIASISKSFSATSIMQLMEAGKLSLDDDFSDLVGFKIRNPKFPETVITLRMILSHTSSINDSQGYFTLDAINPSKNPDWAKCYSDYAPGKGYRYCNLNYNMVGTVIEKLSGERFDNYVKNHILNPLGLYGGYNVDSLDASRFATLHEYDATTKTFKPSPAAYNPRREEIRNYVMGYTTPIFSPTGGMKISATDLAKYMSMHMNMGKYKGKRIMSKKSAKLMQTKVAEEEGYALALTNLNDLIPGKMMVGHTGSAYGLYSAMFFHPKEKFGIVVITNGCNPTYTKGINDVLRAGVNSLYENFIK
ncbi:MAG: serine hydrolase [Sphingobacteriales bacterium 17-39-43]|uniref:serine hydrolase domain-containing protein n=1 Tax=Daejeonella sp. TaxID=2805397 RepID=UPI000BC6FAD5|nr:serine hydrolase domain-containing protein [Daejeonella sp.]OYZ33131.1 MAG: serine hydrolase [Sphingobacteriales bacterium 16-39-50]OZA26540.1 MAG: serine hydrolase [Sphingobacteriales bacterium 17-39-43]OZA62179.1 MAG: serine hydrolase [Sphingobacteriales bacterium 39-40-5]HQS51787.1 serine hydrolase domain-containing protein [Daejeonella sp.]HQT21692.1 serine hydrolase domain-containing protein [Daejeonella sp.]